MYTKPTPEELLKLPTARCGKPIYLVPKEIGMTSAIRALRSQPILGFDTETKPAFKAGQKFPPALVQIASDRAVYLFQMRLIDNIEPLRKLLLAPNIKVGVGIGEDLHRMEYYFKIPMGENFSDLTKLATQKKVEVGSLRGLCGVLLGQRLSKSAQLSNWARIELTHQQVHYAALDAWISREVYIALQKL